VNPPQGIFQRRFPARTACVLALATSCASAKAPPSDAPTRVSPISAAAPAPADGAASQADEKDAQRRVADFLARVAAVRHLLPKAAVEARVLDRASLIASVREHVAREIPRDVIRDQGELLVGFGLVPPDFDYEEGAFRLLEAQLAGFYEPHDKKMYLAADLPGQAADATLAHELVHALQDQHYDLGTHLSYKPEANDRESALQALAEGDATSAMMDLLLKDASRRAIDVPDDLFAAEVEGSMTGTPESTSVPRVLRASLVAPYVDGVLFVHALRRRGLAKAGAAGGDDGGWSVVDEAWRVPPETTEQLLHLDKYDAREPQDMVAMPPPPAAGWTMAYDDIFGEEGLRIAVEEWLPAKAAAAVARGWGGDRAALFRGPSGASGAKRSDVAAPPSAPGAPGSAAGAPVPGRPTAVARTGVTPLAAAWHIRFDRGEKDPDADAREAFKGIADAIKPGQGSPSAVCVERSGLGPLSVARSGRDVVLVAGPYRRDGNRVASDSVCTKSLRWAADILGKRRR
jgi:hypothetical protein